MERHICILRNHKLRLATCHMVATLQRQSQHTPRHQAHGSSALRILLPLSLIRSVGHTGCPRLWLRPTLSSRALFRPIVAINIRVTFLHSHRSFLSAVTRNLPAKAITTIHQHTPCLDSLRTISLPGMTHHILRRIQGLGLKECSHRMVGLHQLLLKARSVSYDG